ncbi:OmpH family outer membrane protein [Spirochaeta isovalerica]|uniref:Outer membrane protein n=1 Tax=Spirochaeta isovalerica TaxID=150 RepID=A0A841R8L9_9SPIO|nr:OmpH family outer membrane protein [Spirochaeta isovalerica]MBB6478822.1 outer membrane protein [Spirochaeta isovalerica]
MSTNKTLLISFFLILVLGGNLIASQITKVGVIDRTRILQIFYAESKGMRELEDMKEEIQQELVRLNDEIKMYEERKLTAENRGDESEALRLDNIIFNKKQYMQDYYRTKNNQLAERQKNLTQSTDFSQQLLEVIEFVALSQGCSIVLDYSTPGLIWSNEEVDITNMVLERLQSLN